MSNIQKVTAPGPDKIWGCPENLTPPWSTKGPGPFWPLRPWALVGPYGPLWALMGHLLRAALAGFFVFFRIFSIFVFWVFRPKLAIFGPRHPENRVRDAILRVLVVGELRRMIFKVFYAKLCKKVVRKTFRFTTITFKLTRWI